LKRRRMGGSYRYGERQWVDVSGCELYLVSSSAVMIMSEFELTYDLSDHGGRRVGFERRHFSYSEHIPERRCGEDRRSGVDRRLGVDRRSGMDRRAFAERRATERGDRRETQTRRLAQERRLADDRRGAMVRDRRGVPRGKEATRERRGQELQELLQR